MKSLLIALVVLVPAVAGGRAQATGKWSMIYPVPANFWDFSVGKGYFCYVDSTSGPYYYVGSTACVSGSSKGVTEHQTDFSQRSTFPYGHAQRIAVVNGPSPPTGQIGLLVTTAEGFLWEYRGGRWLQEVALPSTLPTGMGAYAVTRLVYEATNWYTGTMPPHPVWILGKDGHIYHLVDGKSLGTTWVDASNLYGIGPVAQLSYSAMWEAVVATLPDGESAYYDDNEDTWYNLTTASTAPLAVDSNLTGQFGAAYYGAGGVFQSWCSSRLSNQSCAFSFQVGTWPTWYDLDTQPASPGYPPITSGGIDEAYPTTANAHQPSEEIPINIVEGSYMQLDPSYGGGLRDPGYTDLFFVLTNAFRAYVYEIAQ
jgi:hypothetical protein